MSNNLVTGVLENKEKALKKIKNGKNFPPTERHEFQIKRPKRV